ncbi:MAG: hypothetical protein K2Q45_00490 [Nitrosomonas sp.]|nr:hypothetical protein [Nitrosomonas sp.]
MKKKQKKKMKRLVDKDDNDDKDYNGMLQMTDDNSVPLKKRQIVNEWEAKQYWLQMETIEAFKKVLVKRMNPFFAMRVFKDVSSVATLLSDDKTPEQKALWKGYFKKIVKLTTVDERTTKEKADYETKMKFAKENYTAHPIFLAEYTVILKRTFEDKYGFAKSYRRSHMWMWMLARLIAKEIVEITNQELNKIATASHNMNIRKVLSRQVLRYIRDKNDVVVNPLEITSVITHYDQTTQKYVTSKVFEPNTTAHGFTFEFIWRNFLSLSFEKQYAIFQKASALLHVLVSIVFFQTIASYGNLTVLYNQLKLSQTPLLQFIIAHNKERGKIPPFMFDIGNENIYVFLDRQIDIVTSTYPMHPDVGPGIFSGEEIE